MRYRLSDQSLRQLFVSLEQKGYSMEDLAKMLTIHARTLRDWRRGKYTITDEALKALVSYAKLHIEDMQTIELSDQWQASAAGRAGGRAYTMKYGAPGILESRRSGGKASYKKRAKAADDIFARAAIKTPPNSLQLAEFIGIMIGDGGIGPYQISVTLDMKTDVNYSVYVGELIQTLFGIAPRYRVREDMGCSVTEVSSVSLVEFLVSKGLPVGNKLQYGLRIPDWIKCSQTYVTMCIRGIFDTDGSIYQETHVIKGKTYTYPRMAFVSASEMLRADIFEVLTGLGMRAKIRGNRAVTLEHFTDIKEYFRIVGSSNPKHIQRFIAFGGVG